MFKPTQYRQKAAEYGDLANASSGLEQRRAFRKLEQKFAVLADKEQWLAYNYKNTIHAEHGQPAGTALSVEEEFILR